MNDASSPPLDTAFFGHPKGLQTLFFTEMWERMSYYGMRVLLVLYMTASMQEGGLALTVATAGAIYGLYTGFVYFMGLPGGWIADRLIGGQKAVWYGGITIMIGHIILAIPIDGTFFIGLIFVVLGTGLLKPNIAAIVGQLYSLKDQRRDAGYAIYYMGINLGSFIGYIVCGYLSVAYGWHWAFGAAAIGMAAGLIQYRTTINNLEGVGAEPTVRLSSSVEQKSRLAIGLFLVALALVTWLMMSGTLVFNPVILAGNIAIIFTVIFFLYFGSIFFLGKLNAIEKRGMMALFLVCVASACFWSGFEQAGSSLNLFAQNNTDRMVGDFEIPTGWFGSLNALFIVLLTPFFAAFWINLGKRMVSPAYGIKCAIGIIIMASGFIVMYFAAQIAAQGLKAAPFWLVMVYFLHTVGELCLSPIALSAVSKLAPRRFIGQMMGVFVLTYSIGNIIAGLLAGGYDPNNVAEMPNLFGQIAVFSIGIALVILLLGFFSKGWEKDVESLAD